MNYLVYKFDDMILGDEEFKKEATKYATMYDTVVDSSEYWNRYIDYYQSILSKMILYSLPKELRDTKEEDVDYTE